MGRIAVAPVFTKQAQFVASNAAAFGLTYDNVRLVIRGNPDTTVVVKDTTIAFTPSSDDVALDINVPVVIDGQQFNAGLDYISKTSGVLFHGAVLVTSYKPGHPVPPQQEITIDYVGPGAAVTRLAIAPETTTVIGNASAALSVSAFDAKGAAVATPPLLWSSSDPAIVAVVGTGDKVSAQGQNVRGKARISAISPSGAADTAAIGVGLPPASIVVVSGAGQTGIVHTALTAPGVVQVNAVDGIGVPGVTVVFGAPDGGSVATSSSTTDASGRASTAMTLGTLAGPQAFAATAAGFSVAINATGTPGSAAAVAIAAGNSQIDTVGKTLAALSVRIADAFSNVVPNAVVTWTRVRGTGTLATATSTTNASGVATNTYTLGATAGSDSIAVGAGSATIAGFVFTTKPGNPAAITAVSGAAQTASVGAVLAPFVVKVTDANGNAIEGAVVAWTATNGTISASTTTGADGQTSNPMTLGSAVGPASATAAIAGKSVTFSATSNAGTGAQLAFATQPVGVANNVTLPAVVLSVRDAFGNLVTTNTPVTIALGTNTAGATLSGTLTKTTVNGVATFDDLKVDRAGAGFTLVASSGSIAATTSTAFTITASGSAQLLLIPSSPTSFTKQAGGSVSNPPSLKVVNGSGVPIANAPVRFVTTLGATPIADVTFNADANGVLSSANVPTPDVVGVYTITGTSTSAPGSTVTATLTVTPGAAAALAFTVPNGTMQYSAQTGAAITPTVTVAVRDAFGNSVTSAATPITVALTNANGATLSGTATANAVNGVATFSNLSINLANTYTLTASSSGLTAATSLPVNILAAGGLQLAFAAPIADATADAPLAVITVEVRDAQNQLVTTPAKSVALAISSGPSGASITGGGPVTTVNGVATFNAVRLPKAGTYVLGSTASGVTSTTSTSFTVAAGAAALMTNVAGDNQSAPINTATAVPPKVHVTDASGNPVVDAIVGFSVDAPSLSTIKRTANDDPLTSATVHTDANGDATLYAWTMGPTAMVNTLTAHLANTSVSLTFTATSTNGTASAIAVVSGTPQTGTVGAALAQPFVAKVTDAGGNPVSGVTVTWTATNGTIANTTTSAADGTTSAALTLGHTPGPASATATIAGGANVSFSATANVGAPAQFAITTQPANAAAGATLSSIVVALRDQFGNATTASSAVTIAIGSNPSGGTLSGTVTRNAVSGVVTFDNLSIDKAGNGYTLTVTAGGVTPATSSAFNIIGGAAAHIAIDAGDNQSAVRSTAVATAPRVKVTDAGGNPVANASVTFAVLTGSGSISPVNGLVTTDANGLATLGSWTLGAIVGSNTLDAHLTALPAQAVTFTANASSGPANAIGFGRFAPHPPANDGNNQTGAAGTTLPLPFVAYVTDGANAVQGAVVNWIATDGTIVATSISDVNGLASATMTLGGVLGGSVATAEARLANGNAVFFHASVTVGATAQLAFTTQPANANAGATLPSIVVALRDQFGNPTTGTNAVTIGIASNPSGGVLTGTLTRNAINGVVTFDNLSIDKAGSAYTLTVAAGGLTPATSTAFDIGAGAAAHIAIAAGDNQSATVGAAVATAPRVKVTDAGGTAVANASVTFVVVTGGGSISPANGLATTDANGLATLGSWTLGAVVGSNTLDARLTATPAVAVTFTASASSGPANAIAFGPGNNGNNQTGVAGTALASPFVVKVTDGTNPVQGALVNWLATDGTIAATSVTDAGGLSSNTMTLGGVLGAAASATASLTNGNSVTFHATVTVGAASLLAVTTQPPTTIASGATLSSVTFAIRDAFGNATTATNAVTIALATPAGATLGGTLTRNAVGGTVTFNDLSIDKIGTYTLVATAAGLTSATTGAVTVTPGVAAHLAIVAGDNTAGVINGQTLVHPQVRVTDAAGNNVGAATVSFVVGSGQGSVTPGSVNTDVNGLASATWTLGGTVGPYTLDASVVGAGSVTFHATAAGGTATAIAIQSGDAQTGTVGAPLAQPFIVKVTDAGGNAVSGVTVTWAATNGTIAGTTTTATDGTTSTTLTLGHAPGAASATATTAGVAPVTFNATANVGPAAQLAFTAQPTNSTSAAAMSSVVVALHDQFGNPTAATNAVTIAIGANPASGTLGGTLTRNAVNGTVTFNDLTIDKAGSGYTLSVTSAGLTAATSNAFNVVAGAAAQIAIVAGDNVNAIISTATAPAPSVRVTDAAGNVVNGASVTFAIASGGGSVTPTPVVTTNASGIATIGAWTLGSVVGPNTLTATLANNASVTFHANASSAAPAAIAIQSGDGQTGTVGTALGSPLVVHVTDAGGNAVAGAVVSWTATNGTITATSTSDATGNASNTLTLGGTAGAAASSATATIPNGQHVAFTASATAGVPAHLVIGAQPTNGTAAVTLSPITVGLRDAFNNPTTGTNAITIAIATNPGSGTLSGTLTQNAVAGTATFNDLSIQKSGVGYTLTVTSSGLTSATTNTFNVVAGAAANVTINAGNNVGAAVATATSPAPQVKVTDANGNAVAGATITYTILTGGGTTSPANGAVTSDANGLATLGAWTLGPAIGTNTLEARLNAGTAVTFTANASSAAVSTVAIVSGDAQAVTVAQPLAPFVVHVADSFGNPVTGAIVNWTGAGGTLSAASSTTAANGDASTTMTLGVVSGSYTVTATVSNGQHVTFAFTALPSAATQLAFTAEPSNTIAGGTIAPVAVTVRDIFNNTVTASSAAVTLAIANNPATGTLGGTVTRNAVNGIATFNDLSIDHAGTGYTLSAASTGLTSATSTAFSISVGIPAHIAIVDGDGQSSIVDQNTAIPPKVKITDASGNVVPNASVTFTVLTGGGSLKTTSGSTPATAGTVTTDAGGFATIDSWKLGPTIGTNTLEARVSPSLAVTFTAGASSSTPNAIAIVSGNTQSGVVATALAAPLVVKVTDVNTNPVTGAAVSWTATNGSLTATTFTASDGTTSTPFTLGTVAGASSAVATIGNGQHQTFAATALPGAAASMQFTSQPPSTTANVVFPSITLQLRDQFGNNTPVASSVTLSLGTNPTGAALTGNVTRSAVNGVVTFDDVAVDAAGAGFRLLATSPGVTSATSNAFNVASDVVSFVTVTSGDNQTGTVNTAAAVPLVITVADAGHAVITAANITWSSRHGTVLSATETSSGTDGQTSITINYSTLAGGDTITATSINGHTASFVVSAVPGAPVKLAFIVPNGATNYSGNVSSPVANPANLQVAIEDVFGNVVTTSTSAVSLTLNNPNGGSLLNAPTTNATAGIVTWDQATITKVGVYTVTATSSGLSSATSLPISISFGSVTGVQFVTRTGTGNAGVAVSPAIQLKVTDPNGDLVLTPVSITLSISFSNPAGGTMTGTLTVNTDQGFASFTDIVFPTAGTYRVKADATASGFGAATSGNFVISP